MDGLLDQGAGLSLRRIRSPSPRGVTTTMPAGVLWTCATPGKGLSSGMRGRSWGGSSSRRMNSIEDNTAVQRLIELFGGTVYKTYRMYERPVRGPGADQV